MTKIKFRSLIRLGIKSGLVMSLSKFGGKTYQEINIFQAKLIYTLSKQIKTGLNFTLKE